MLMLISSHHRQTVARCNLGCRAGSAWADRPCRGRRVRSTRAAVRAVTEQLGDVDCGQCLRADVVPRETEVEAIQVRTDQTVSEFARQSAKRRRRGADPRARLDMAPIETRLVGHDVVLESKFGMPLDDDEA